MSEPNQKEYTLNEVVFQSPRMGFSDIDLMPSCTDLDVFESVDKPYITAKLILLDTAGFLENADILGGEKITIALQSNRPGTKEIRKTFFITKILKQERTNDSVQVLMLHLIEDIGYESNLFNVNRYYEGKGSEIIKKIVGEYLQTGLATDENDFQKFKLIIPNLTPIDAASWISKKLTTEFGYPYFLFSTLAGKKLSLKDLGTMLSPNNIINPDPLGQGPNSTFIYSQALAGKLTSHKERLISGFTVKNGEDLFTIINKGFIGSKYTMIQAAGTDEAADSTFDFDVVKDLLKPLISTMPIGQNNPPYTPKFSHNGKPYNELPSRHKTFISGNYAWRTQSSETEFDTGVGEERDIATYKLQIMKDAVEELLKTEHMEMSVNGTSFIDGNIHSTIGNQISCTFLSSVPEAKVSEQVDHKLSGNYLIYRTRHMFKSMNGMESKYDLSMSCVKLGRRNF